MRKRAATIALLLTLALGATATAMHQQVHLKVVRPGSSQFRAI